MLGLGLSITSVSGLRSLASKLLGILRSRSTYSENNVSSNAIIDAIDNVGVLDDATILLTPTAYSDARVHSAKTYTGELITNGGFDTDSDWTKGTYTSIQDGKATITNSTGEVSLSQSIGVAQKKVKITYTISDYVSGVLRVQYGAINGANRSANGTYTDFITGSNVSEDLLIYSLTSDTSLSIDNVSVVDVSSDFDFDRASSATRINSDANVEDITSDLARINYDSNGENGHWLLEPTSTNLLPYSEDFSGYTKGGNTTLTYESDVVAPDGSLGVYRLQNPASANTSLNLVNTTAQSISVWAKAVNSGTNNQFSFYNSSTYSDIQTTSSEWQRFEYSWASSAGGTYFINNEGDTFATDIYIWGAQLEDLSYATSYIPTLTGSTVTRAAETLTGSGNSTLINSTEGVLYAEIAALVDDNSAREITLSDGTADNRIELRYGNASNRIQLVARTGGVVQASLTNSTNNILNFNKVAVKWKANDFALWINGIEQGTDTSGSTPIGLNELQFNEGDGAGGEFLGKCKALAVFDRALTDQELTDLTS